MDEIIVSIICNTFNHEEYISKCLEGFINQKTTFNYEILVHDDASTDRTASIIKDYQKKYPHLIKPIFQDENKYSKGINVTLSFQYPRVQGKYIAFCEGDDYWTENNKLQIQYEYLERYPAINICSHSTTVLQNNRKKCLIMPKKEFCIIPLEEVIYGGGGFVATNSLFYRKNIIDSMPDFIKNYHIDYSLQIYGSINGGMLFIPNVMSVYNYMTPSSWSKKVLISRKNAKNVENKLSKMLLEFNDFTNNKYDGLIKDCIAKLEFIYLLKVGPFIELRNKKYKKYKKELSIKSKILMCLKELFPFYFERKIKD